MASIEESLVALVTATPTITTLLGTSPVRFYPLRKPQGAALPVVAYQRISTVRYSSHGGYSSLATSRIQLTVWAASYGSGKAVSDALRRALLGYRGTVGGVRIDGLLPAGERDDFEPTTQEWLRMIDFRITHQET